MYCSECGDAVPTGTRYCARCGADVTGEGRIATGAAPPDQDRLRSVLQHATLGEYEILGELGRGGMAVVYLAHDIALDRKVAIKVIYPALLAADSGMAERFMREARTAASLSHPHIIPIYAVRERDEILYFVMKFVTGQTLEGVIRDVGRLPPTVVRAMLGQAGGALGYAHRHGVVHRDVKPGNIMLDEDGWVMVTDFGIAKVTESGRLTMTGATVGTPTYMSPEQCGGGEVTGASDQYSLGVVGYEMLTGEPPFKAAAPLAMMYEHCHTSPRPIRSLRRDCPEDLEAAVMRMLAKESGTRWPSLEEAVAAIGMGSDAQQAAVRSEMRTLAQSSPARALLERVQTPESPIPQSRARLPVRRSGRRGGLERRRSWLVPGGLAGLGVALVIAFWLGGDGPAPAPVVEADIAMPAAPQVAALEIEAPSRTLRPGQTVQLSPVARDSAGRVVRAAAVTWTSEDPGLLAVRANGTVTALAPGRATITAQSGARVASLTFDVVAPPAARSPTTTPTVAHVAVLGPAEAEVGDTLQVRARPQDASGRTVTAAPAVWRSSDPSVALVTPTGLVRAAGAGTAELTAIVEGVAGTLLLVVHAAAVTSIRVQPDRAAVAAGDTVRLRAELRDRAGRPLTDRAVTWSSGAPEIATVSPEGVVRAHQAGEIAVTAASGEMRGTARITVRPAARAADPEAGVERAMELYRRAIESRDVTVLRRAYPGMTREQERAWREFFAGVSDLNVTFQVAALRLSGDTAHVEVDAVYDYRADRHEQRAVSFMAALARADTGWRLVSVR